MKIVIRSRKGKVIKVLYEINSITELEKFIYDSPLKFNKRINDFIKFSNKDIPYITTLINTTPFISQTQLICDSLSKNIFKYHYKSQREYWRCRGWIEEDVTKKVSEYQSSASIPTWIERKKNSNFKSSMNTCIEYWIKKGYSNDEAKKKLKERQNTFTLEKCIKKHGEKKGNQIYNDRQVRWINSLYDGKTDEEIIAFEKSKMVDFCKASKPSLKIFLPLLDWLKKEKIIFDNKEYYLGHQDKKEYFIYNKDHQILFFYDFVIPHLKIIIEFNGHVWHPTDDAWKPLKHVKSSKSQIMQKEKLKEETVIQHGFSLLKIWDTESDEVNLQKCKDFITTNHTSTTLAGK